MTIRTILISGQLLLFALIGLVQPVFAEDDLESLRKEITKQREELSEQTRKLEELEQRLDEAKKKPEQHPTHSAIDTPDAATETKAASPEREPIVGVSQREELYGAFSNAGFAKSVPMFGSD